MHVGQLFQIILKTRSRLYSFQCMEIESYTRTCISISRLPYRHSNMFFQLLLNDLWFKDMERVQGYITGFYFEIVIKGEKTKYDKTVSASFGAKNSELDPYFQFYNDQTTINA